ncbi:MAG TPA: branched-chain amino acid ABC transporter substrate-binding protein [Longilinea sp.]|nr:branched-chain amino acid ABC transporter substrate-binding protein [Longilinea sp.]
MKASRVLYVFALLAIVLASCGPAATTAAPTQPPAATMAPAATSAPASGAPAACATDTYGCAKIAPGTTVKIGMGGPMTGDNASYGIDISQGGQIAIKDGGDIDGWKFELVAQDDGGTAEGGAAVANKLVTDPSVVAIAGHIFSGATAAAIPIYDKAGLPMLSPSATNPDLTKPQTGLRVFNRIAYTDDVQGKFSADYLFKKLNFTKIAILHDGSTYGKGLATIVQTDFVADGGTVTSFDAITTGAGDFTTPLAKVASGKPQALFFGGYTGDASVLVNEMAQSGLQGVVFFGDDGTYGAQFLTLGGKNAEGAYAVTLEPPSSPANDAFKAAYKAAYGKDPGVLSPYTWNGYDVVAALISVVKTVAIKGTDGNLYIPRGAMVTGVRTLKDYHGLSGTFTCDATGECNSSGPIYVIVKNGAWAPAP